MTKNFVASQLMNFLRFDDGLNCLNPNELLNHFSQTENSSRLPEWLRTMVVEVTTK